MAIFREYREAIRGVLDEAPTATRFQKIGLAIITVAGVRSEKVFLRRIDGYPVVDSPVVGWNTNMPTDEELNAELDQILKESPHEPESIS